MGLEIDFMAPLLVSGNDMKFEIAEEHKSKRLLIVDDDRSISLLLATILRRAGFSNISTANNGVEALKTMGLDETITWSLPQRPPFDAVLLDIMMPRVNGFDLCRRLRNIWGNEIIVMLITGFDFEHHHAHYIESGADDFLSKPINPRELLSRLEVHLTRLDCKSEISKQGTVRVEDEIEMTMIGPYRVLRTMSWSGSVVVYEAVRRGEHQVIKILTKQAMEYDDVLQRFVREADLLKSFSHPNIVSLLDRGEHHGLEYFVTEYIEGENLENFIAEQPKPEFSMIHSLASDIASALQHVHEHGVVHRDIKLKNIFISSQNEAKIGDFGIALAKGDVRLTQPGYAIGTPIYMAPEQFEGGELTPKIDIYAFGATMYHLTTGLPPFTAGNAMELLRKHLREKAPYMRSARDDIPESWDELIVDRCLSKKPEERPESMAEVVEVLNRVMAL